MKRRALNFLLNLLAGVSLLIVLIATSFWVRGYWRGDTLEWRSEQIKGPGPFNCTENVLIPNAIHFSHNSAPALHLLNLR